MTDQEAATEPAEKIFTLPVMFQGREIYARMPSTEQLLVWQRTVKRLTDAPIDMSWTAAEVMTTLDRLRRIVDSLIVNRADIDWMDDQFLDEKMGLKDLAPFITQVTEAFAKAAEEHGNREERRAAAKTPAKKAARKKAGTPR